jgi:hypothetical protein
MSFKILFKNNYDYFFSLISFLAKFSVAYFALPIILRKLPSVDYGIWTFFLTIGSLTSLIDFGFSTVFSRHLTYILHEFNLTNDTDLKLNGLLENQRRTLTGFVSLMKIFYFLACIIVSLIAIIVFFVIKNKLLSNYPYNINIVFLSYIVYVVSIVVNMYFLYLECILIATQKITQIKIVNITNSIFYLFIVFLLLLLLFYHRSIISFA